jgi:hypothetical protein
MTLTNNPTLVIVAAATTIALVIIGFGFSRGDDVKNYMTDYITDSTRRSTRRSTRGGSGTKSRRKGVK